MARATATVTPVTVTASHSSARLVVEKAAARPGEAVWAALVITPRKGWHTYWKNPGDAGLPPSLAWAFPGGGTGGFRAGAFEWPAPQRFQVKSLASYGYDGTVVLPVQVFVPRQMGGTAAAGATLGPAASSTFTLAAQASWLVCADSCIPQEGPVAVSLTVGPAAAASPSADAALIQAALARVPRTDAALATTARVDTVAKRLVVTLPAALSTQRGELFLEREEVVEPGPVPQLQVAGSGGGATWSAPLGRVGNTLKPKERLWAVWVPAGGSSASTAPKRFEVVVQ